MSPTTPSPVLEVVAIDGPSGSGKSTIARLLAQRLGFAYLDTGAMYRAVTWHFLEHQLNDLDDAQGVHDALATLQLEIDPQNRVWLTGRDVTAHLRSREVEARVSSVSALQAVRERMRALQRTIAERNPVVAEGRDMGSVVFPQARFKFYLDAEPEERARRRQRDFAERGRAVSEAEVLEELAVRDRLDSTRKDAPLRRTHEAVYCDTTGMSITEVVDMLEARIRAAGDRAQGDRR